MKVVNSSGKRKTAIARATIKGGKGLTTDAGTHVPFIANRPGTIPAGRVCDDLIDFTDFLPTLAQATGSPVPQNLTLDGRSFLPQLKGKKGNPREWVFCHYDPEWGNFTRSRFVRDQRWKLYDDGRLYDVPADPLEEHPLEPGSGGPGAAAARQRLQQVLDRLR